MSWAASAWAKEQGRTAGKAMPPALRYLLVCVADRTNDDTLYTWASPKCLAEDVGSSVDSIKEGLRRLEAMGLLARVRRLKPDGSHDTSLLILLRDEACRAKAAELGWTAPASGDEGREPDEPQDVGGVGGNGPPPYESRGWGETDPHGGGKSTPTHIDEPEKGTYSPLPPSRVSPPAAPSADRPLGVVPAGIGPARALPDGYDPDPAGADAFLAAWRAETQLASAADVPEVVRRLWRRLDAADRRRARADLGAWCRQMQRERRSLGSATRYLRDKAWQTLDHIRAGRKEGTAAPTIFVREGSPEWDAWARHEARHGRVLRAIPSKHEAGRGWWMPTLWPPRADEGGAGPDPPAAVPGEGEDEVARLLARG